MQTFLSSVINQLVENKLRSEHSIIFPNRRSARFCKKILVENTDYEGILPEFITIEELILDITNLQIVDKFELNFLFYKHYRQVFKEEPESIDQVLSWSSMLIDDFSEIDRNLIPPNEILNYLEAVKEIEHWSKSDQPTSMIKDYLQFWEKLPDLYHSFTKDLLDKHCVYQGLAYRQALSKFKKAKHNPESKFFFVGFNALNKAEEELFKFVLENNLGQVFWDTDDYFLNQKHTASFFLRNYQFNWKFYQRSDNKLPANCDSFKNEKTFNVYANQGNTLQAKCVGEIVDQLTDDELNDTAILLGDESLLESIMFSIPEKVNQLNITMGIPLNKTHIGAFFHNYILLCKTSSQSFFHKDLNEFLESSFLIHLFRDDCKQMIKIIKEKQHYFVYQNLIDDLINKCSNDFKSVIGKLLKNTPEDSYQLNEKMLAIISTIKNHVHNEYYLSILDKIEDVLYSIKALIDKYSYKLNLSTYLDVYADMLSKSQIDLKGEKDKGLQIMGLLESRCLDFKNVIITSVNEGVLPQGKTVGSFIPFDIKKQYGLPTYQEKDKIYSYHFFRVLQRAQTIHLLYNEMSGKLTFTEESRFIKILEENQMPSHHFKRYYSELQNQPHKKIKSVPKTREIQKAIKKWMTSGVSASALNTYIRNPYDFYQKYILKVKEPEEIFDLESPKIFGEVIHESVDELYRLLPINKTLKNTDLEKLKKEAESTISDKIIQKCGQNAFDKGSNIIGFKAAKKQIQLLIDSELKVVKDNDLKILEIENDNYSFRLSTHLFEEDIVLKGKIDRVDMLNGTKRIVDYKTGESKKLTLSDFDQLSTDENSAHALQTLFYSLLKSHNFDRTEEWIAGNIYFRDKPVEFKPLKINQQSMLNHESLSYFSNTLIKLLSEIYNLETAFIDKSLE
jgi:hypothetical protein